jgi:hypothetical protein
MGVHLTMAESTAMHRAHARGLFPSDGEPYQFNLRYGLG